MQIGNFNYTSNKEVNKYLNDIDDLCFDKNVSNETIESLVSLKFMIMHNDEIFKKISHSNISSLAKYKNNSQYIIYNQGDVIQQNMFRKQLMSLSLPEGIKENISEYITNVIRLSNLFKTENWELFYLATIIISSMTDILKTDNAKTYLNLFDKNVKLFKQINTLVNTKEKRELTKTTFDLYHYLISVPHKHSFINLSNIDKLNTIEENVFENAKKNIEYNSEKYYPYAILNFNSFFTRDLGKDYISLHNQQKLEMLKIKYAKNPSREILRQMQELSKSI